MMYLSVDDLVEKKLVVKKDYLHGPYNGLSVLKYHRRVFYDNLWNKDHRLKHCRGTVVDSHGKVIVYPFDKVFNLGENGTKVSPNTEVIAPRKVNGFLGCVTKTIPYGFIYSTTGSLDSEYAELVKKHTAKFTDKMYTGITYMFEICDKSDPHIIEEQEGAYLIGMRDIFNGHLYEEDYLDLEAVNMGCMRPFVWKGLFKDLPKVNHEGYMIRLMNNLVVCKVKSPYYLAKKALQRVGKTKANMMWDNGDKFKQQLDEEFYEIFDNIKKTFSKEQYLALTEQERGDWINEYFKENVAFAGCAGGR